jgi:hypothetical protein
MIKMPRQHYVTLHVEEDTDTGHLLYEVWSDAKLARVRLVPFSGETRETVYTADLQWHNADEVSRGFLLAAGVLTGHTGVLRANELYLLFAAGVDAQSWPAGKREGFVVERLEAILSWRESAAEEAAQS